MALKCAMLVAGAVLLIGAISEYFVYGKTTWFSILLFPAVAGISSFVFVSFFIQQFIIAKIRLIYKTIRSLKKDSQDLNLNFSRDLLKEVNREVIDWADDQRKEIEVLKEKENFRREFIGNLAHEIKTPIFAIQGYILTLLEGGMNDPRINKKFLEKASRSTDRMVAMIEDLDSISQLESGKLKLYQEEFDVVALAQDIIDSLEMRAKEHNVTLKFNKKYDKPILVHADPNRISQVLSNLLVNSINYAKPEGGETEIRFFDIDEDILIEVADNGIGIDQKDIPRIFERFFRVDKHRSRHTGGSGLGLSICKHIINAHGYTMDVRSTKGIGTTFLFPLKKVG
ncbi:sensor histidine kinase [Luteibaculum oceani]|uniref:histidine kinase n=1 Tax=Luteibaculum oceani TaxID=1294296 RepID=A0A5C6V2P4_9FLAO|nr:ATP-binding protein [Luteibaculum oceani]TXC78921.1 sensor histidine kinase [Luteibaculum oceani]